MQQALKKDAPPYQKKPWWKNCETQVGRLWQYVNNKILI